jgi:hypothetical protein
MLIFSKTVYWVWLNFCGKVPMVPIHLHAKNQSHLMHGSRDIREMDEGDYIDFLENRVLSCPEIYWVFVS